jgi:hypothetical protein
MGWLLVLLGGVATALFFIEGTVLLPFVTGVAAIVNLWSYGVMHNLAVENARRRSTYRGGFGDFLDADLTAIPSWLTAIHIGSSLSIAGLLAWSIWMLWA